MRLKSSRMEGARMKPTEDKMAIITLGYILLKAGAAVGSKLDPATLSTDRLQDRTPFLGEITPSVASSNLGHPTLAKNRPLDQQDSRLSQVKWNKLYEIRSQGKHYLPIVSAEVQKIKSPSMLGKDFISNVTFADL